MNNYFKDNGGIKKSPYNHGKLKTLIYLTQPHTPFLFPSCLPQAGARGESLYRLLAV